ncbi:MAG: threonine ammonia-lyase [Thermomicrobiales bacterium]
MTVTAGSEIREPSISLADIKTANSAIDPIFLKTPQFVDPGLAAQLGCELLLKVETLNPVRSFKGRGASWTMQSLAGDIADSGIERVICASAGNFGQAIAYAGRTAGIPVTVFAATTANEAKIARIREFGAEVVLTGRDFDAAKESARAYAAVASGGRVRFVEDAADLETVVGAGTIGLELAPEKLDLLLVPLGNGALINGIATWLKVHSPDTRIVGICAAGAPSMYKSWKAGKVIETEAAETSADGIAVRLPIASAVHLTMELVDDIVLVAEETIDEALRVARDHAGLLLEPSGVIGIAAVLAYPELRQGRVGTILTGANLSPQVLAELTGR